MAGPAVTFAGSQPADDLNGAIEHATRMMDEKYSLVPVVALMSVKKIVDDVEADRAYPSLRFRHIELAMTDAERKEVNDLLQRMYARRTGKAALPFEGGDELPPTPSFPEEES